MRAAARKIPRLAIAIAALSLAPAALAENYTVWLAYGNSPVPPGVKGYKDKGYTFVGWSPAIAPMTRSQTYTAVFSK